ncbi:MAG: hypothetical protein E3K32_05430 [wastewater metagenome]|nr:hypothetical protein [Candidatus Loosdrechtia aerotolerans]
MIFSDSFYRGMFFIAAIWNLLGCAFLLFLPRLIFVPPYMEKPFPPLFYQAWLALALVFGIGYYFVYKDMYANKNIVIMGILGKTIFVIIFAVNMLMYTNIPKIFWGAVCGDAVFVIFFLMFLAYAE